jgi:CBS domain-containing protein
MYSFPRPDPIAPKWMTPRCYGSSRLYPRATLWMSSLNSERRSSVLPDHSETATLCGHSLIHTRRFLVIPRCAQQKKHATAHPFLHYGGAEMFLRALDIMSKEVITVSQHTRVTELAQLLTEKGISGVPVIDGSQRLVGIVTEADLLARKLGQNTVYDIMSTEVISVQDDAAVAEVAAILSRHKIKRVPVMRNGQLIGIISRADVVKAFPSV